MRFRDYLLAAGLALIVVAAGLALESVMARSAELPATRAAAAADDMPKPMPVPPPLPETGPASEPPSISVTMVFEAPCGEAADILDLQREVFGQVPIGAGTVNREMSVILLVAPSGSWSIVALTGAGAVACGVSSGGDWRTK